MKYYKKKVGNYTYFAAKIYDEKRRTQKEISSKTLKGLKEKYAQKTAKIQQNIVNDKVPFGDFFTSWFYNFNLITKKPTTKDRYDRVYQMYIKDSSIYNIFLCDLSTEDIQELYNKIFEEHRLASRVKAVHKLINPALRYAFETGRTQRNIGNGLKIPIDDPEIQLARMQKDDVRPMTLDEHFRFVKHIEGHRLEGILRMAIDTGMRQGELIALTWADIDTNNMQIHINKTFSSSKNIDTGKTEKNISVPKTLQSNRIIPLPEVLLPVLKRHKKSQIERYIRFGQSWTEKGLAFPSNTFTYFCRVNLLKQVKKVYKEVGIENKTFHDLRHTYATRLFELGENAKTVQKLLGHAEVSTTLNIYTHVLDNLKQKTATAIDSLYKCSSENKEKSSEKAVSQSFINSKKRL